MNYKEEMKAMFEKMYKIGFEAGFTEGVKAKFDKSEGEDKTVEEFVETESEDKK